MVFLLPLGLPHSLWSFAMTTLCNEATTAFQNDVMLALRLTPNDADGTEILLGIFQDLDHSATLFRVEASRRIGDRLKAFLEIGAFTDMDSLGLLYDTRDDGFLRLELISYY